MSFETMILSTLMALFQMTRLQQQHAVIDNYLSIERLPDKSSIFSAELHALYLALDRVETADDVERNFIIFSDSKSALQAISGQDWTHPLVLYILERLNWLVQYQEKRILFYWIPSHVGIIGNGKVLLHFNRFHQPCSPLICLV